MAFLEVSPMKPLLKSSWPELSGKSILSCKRSWAQPDISWLLLTRKMTSLLWGLEVRKGEHTLESISVQQGQEVSR